MPPEIRPETTPPVDDFVPRTRWWRAPLLVVVAGMLVLAATDGIETRAVAGRPWKDGILFPEGTPDGWSSEGLVPLRARRIDEAFALRSQPWLEQVAAMPGAQEAVSALDLTAAERVVMLSVPPEDLESLLAEGRLPQPGAPEVLAGSLTRFDTFPLDGRDFRVTGHLQATVGGLAFSYVLPADPAFDAQFSSAVGATEGCYDPRGVQRFEGQEPDASNDATNRPPMVVGIDLTQGRFAVAAIVGLILIAFGGSWAQVRLLAKLSPRAHGLIAPLLRETIDRRALFMGLHVLLYGVLFLMMAVAPGRPMLNRQLGTFVENEFAEGSLSYIGDAYASRNVVRAALATFVHNYFVATILMTLLPSFLVPFAGFFKTLISFAFVGFVMSPIWVGCAHGFVYHGITMTLELEAYIVASFAAVLFPVYAARSLMSGPFLETLARGFRLVTGAAAVSGIMLAGAAAYEAATIILFR